jgi:hypothetical protein
VSRNRNTLYFFVTPTIFKDFQSLEEVSYQKKLEIEKLEGNIRLIDRHFRRVGIGDSKLSLEDIEESGGLDIPRYSPLTPLGLTERVVDVDGIPVHPAVSAEGTEATIAEEGTREIKLGSAGAQTTTRPQNK